jgi:hypothetical protein
MVDVSQQQLADHDLASAGRYRLASGPPGSPACSMPMARC